MKRLIKLVLCCMLIVGLTACSNNTDSSTSKIANGTYEGVGKGKGGDITLNVTIENDLIKDIEVVSHSETTGFDSAMDTLKEEVLKFNSIDVDSVTGATLTSQGYLSAIENALTNANATKDMLAKVDVDVEKGEKQEIKEEYDVVVIGAGGAGYSAAIEAKNAGANVVILEKMPAVGGNTLISGAEYAAPNNWLQEKENLEDSVDLMVEDMLVGGDHKNNPDLVKVVAENALDGALWLKDEVGVIWEDELMFFGGHSVKRSLIPLNASGVEIITKLDEKAKSMDIPVYLNTQATELIVEDGKVVGVKATGKDNDYIFTCDAVVMATGGFGSNVDMRIQYNPEIDETILSTNTVGSTGDGILMAQAIGADVEGMEYIQTYPICDPLTGTLLYFDDARLYGHTIIVNKEGKRFVEELGRRDEMSLAIKAQTGNVCYELIDQNGYVESKLEENHAQELEYLYDNDLLVKADTLQEVAEFFGVDYETLQETVDNYNSYVENGEDPEFNKRSLPSKIEKAPYYMIKAAPAVHHTMGGLVINTDAQVLNTNGEAIEGLYAAGEVTGGIHGTNRLGSCALADITVFGRIAGQNAASYAK